ncbi:hypothetical protein AALB_4016 [Agarivorans albus MKT 106]|uniref:Uncharacterized protein n=1 Tax=Agarivorans albus MKT 106 TaxID=1331007 RepID=R9PUC6_AGAAL|nr:hypothetical protein AALB_4016 [Agarivorans albus MKT 106]
MFRFTLQISSKITQIMGFFDTDQIPDLAYFDTILLSKVAGRSCG